VFVTAAVASLALTALVVASASAAIVPAKFSGPEFKVSTTGLTVKRNGLEPKTCTFKPATVGLTESEQFYILDNFEGDTKLLCPNGSTPLQMILRGVARYDNVAGTYSLHVNDYTTTNLYGPWGSYWQQSKVVGGGFNGTWVNGSGATASTVTFSNQTFGYTAAGLKMTMEGTVKVTTPSGGLITLSP
jgi:hypothetical protein